MESLVLVLSLTMAMLTADKALSRPALARSLIKHLVAICKSAHSLARGGQPLISRSSVVTFGRIPGEEGLPVRWDKLDDYLFQMNGLPAFS